MKIFFTSQNTVDAQFHLKITKSVAFITSMFHMKLLLITVFLVFMISISKTVYKYENHKSYFSSVQKF